MRLGRKQKPKSLSEIPRRWDAVAPVDIPDDPPPAAPGKLLTGLILIMSLAMIGSVIMLWQSGSLAPGQAVASPSAVEKAPRHEAVGVVLDSARKLMTQSDWARAETVLRQASMEFPEEQEIRIALAETFLAMNKLPESYDQYEKALAIGPREPKLEFAAGQVASKAGLTGRAEEHFSMAQTADPRNPTYPMMLGMIQRKQGNVESAKASLLRSVNLDPENAFCWGTMADIALNENRTDLAIQHIEKARRLQPESREWRLIEARARKRKGEPERALMLLVSLDASQKREVHVARLIAECYGMLGRHADAAVVLVESSKADPVNAELAYEAAAALERAGNKPEAMMFAKQAEGLGHKGAATLIQRLGQ
jgi:predicted Zn-dependent protease